MAVHDAPAEGAALIETLVARRTPIVRGAITAAAVAVMFALAGCSSFISDQAAASAYHILQSSFEAAKRQPDLLLAREAMRGGIVQLESFALAYPSHVEFKRLYAESVCQYAVAFVFDDREDAQLGGRAADQQRLALRLTTLARMCEDANLALLPTALRTARQAGGEAWTHALASARRAEVAPLRWLATVDAVRLAIDPSRGMVRFEAIVETMNRCAQLAPGDHDADAELMLATLTSARGQFLGGDDGEAAFALARKRAGPGALMVEVMYARGVGAARKDRALFEATLRRVLDADLTRWPDRRLSNELAKVKAARYLGAAERFVPLVEPEHRTAAGTGQSSL